MEYKKEETVASKSRQEKRQEKRESTKKKVAKRNIPKITKEGFVHNEDLVADGKDISIRDKRKIATEVKDIEVDLTLMGDPVYSRVPLKNVEVLKNNRNMNLKRYLKNIV